MEDDSPNRQPESGAFPSPPPLPAARPDAEGDFTRVEVERMDGGGGAPGGGVFIHQSIASIIKPPVVSAWICLALSWLFLGSSIPFTVFLGLPLDIAALFLAMLCLGRGAVISGVLILILGTVGSLIVYLVGLFTFLGGLSGGHGLL